MREFAQQQSQPAHRASVDRTRLRAAVSAPPDRVHPLVQLQRLVGNRAVQRLLRPEPGERGPAGAVPAIVQEVLAAPGQPLDPATRAVMERRFGHDFGRVRVHTDSRATESARSVLARAYTVGPHLVFGDGEYAPGTHQGSELLAHELAHTVQQAGVASAPLSVASDAVSEQSAESAGRDIASGRGISTGLPAAAAGLARAPVAIDAYPPDMLAKALAEVQQRLKNPSYSGRDRDVDLYMALKWEADKRAAASARAEAVAYLESMEPPPQEERPEVSSKFTPGGFTDIDIDPGREERAQAEQKRTEQWALDRQREEEGRPARLNRARRYLILHGAGRYAVPGVLTSFLTATDLRVLVKHGLEPPGFWTRKYARKVIEIIDKIVPRDPMEDREDLKEIQRRAALQEDTGERIKGMASEGPHALGGRVVGYGTAYFAGKDPLWGGEAGALFGKVRGARTEFRYGTPSITRSVNEPVYPEATHEPHRPPAQQMPTPDPIKPGVPDKPGLSLTDVPRRGASPSGATHEAPRPPAEQVPTPVPMKLGVTEIVPAPKPPMKLAPKPTTTAKPPKPRWEGTLKEQLQAMGKEIQGRGAASGDVEADLLASGVVQERPAFQRPSGSSTIIQANPQAPNQLPTMGNLKGLTAARLRSIQRTFNALMEHVMQARERFNEEGFTPNQTEMIKRAPTEAQRNGIRAREYGNRIDAMVKESISGDRRLDHLGVSERRQPGPDLFDPLNDVWYDMTTARSWPQHVEDYGSSGWGVHAPTGR